MKALVYHGPHDIRFDSVPDPTPPDLRGAIVRIDRAAICGSDLHLYEGRLGDLSGLTIGHEFVGEVVEVGSEVRAHRVGDKVMVSGVIGCGACPACASGRVTQCANGLPRVFGTTLDLPGGQAEAVAVPLADHACRAIPDGVSMEQATLLTDILPTGYFGARNAGIAPGHSVVILGLGPVGLMALMSAQLFGPARIIAVDRVPERLALAERLGATPVDASGDVRAAVMEATHGVGPDAVIEAVGADETIQMALDLVRPGGTVSVVGVNMNLAFPLNMASAFLKNLTFKIGLVPVPELWPNLIPLVASGRLQPEVIYTHHLPLCEGPNAYDLFAAREKGTLKILLDPTR